MTAEIIDFAEYKQHGDAEMPPGCCDPMPFVGLPFLSKDIDEYGWPEKFWLVAEPKKHDHEAYHQGMEYARMAYQRMQAEPSEWRAVRCLQYTLDAIIVEQAKLRAKGGKRSRGIESTGQGFIDGITELLVTGRTSIGSEANS